MSSDDKREGEGLMFTPTRRRVMNTACEILEHDPEDLLFQHSSLCQTAMPYRDPKGALRWERSNGHASLLIESGSFLDPRTDKWVHAGLPFGSKARLIFAHLNTRALRADSNVIELEEESFTEFVRTLQGSTKGKKRTAPNGAEIRAYKDQLRRFSVVRFSVGHRETGGRIHQSSPQFIEELDILWNRDSNQRLLWPEKIVLSAAYWSSLKKHAVPLDARALRELSHNALAIDIYCWLAQRLHRISTKERLVLSRAVLHRQFGEGYKRERAFWSNGFLPALRQVHALYAHARLAVEDDGLHLFHSSPPIRSRQFFTVGEVRPFKKP